MREDGEPKRSFLRPVKRSLGFWSGLGCVVAGGVAEALGGHGLREAGEIIAISGGAVGAPVAVGMLRDKLLPSPHADSVEATFKDLVEKTRTGAIKWTGETSHTDSAPWGDGWHAKLKDGTQVELLQSILPPFHRGLAVKPPGQSTWTVFSRPRDVVSQGFADVIAAKKERESPRKLPGSSSDPEAALMRVRHQLQAERDSL